MVQSGSSFSQLAIIILVLPPLISSKMDRSGVAMNCSLLRRTWSMVLCCRMNSSSLSIVTAVGSQVCSKCIIHDKMSAFVLVFPGTCQMVKS